MATGQMRLPKGISVIFCPGRRVASVRRGQIATVVGHRHDFIHVIRFSDGHKMEVFPQELTLVENEPAKERRDENFG